MDIYMGVSKNRAGPPTWMVKIMENPYEKFGGTLPPPIFGGTPLHPYFSATSREALHDSPEKKKNAPGPVGWDNPQDIRKIAPP